MDIKISLTIKNKLRKIKNIPFIDKQFVKRRAYRQEKEYSRLSEDAYLRYYNSFNSADILECSKRLFLKNSVKSPKSKTNTKEIHLFIIDRPSIRGSWFQEEIFRNFKVNIFSITRHMHGYIKKIGNLITHSAGLDKADRLRPWIIPEDYKGWFERVQKDIIQAVKSIHKRNPVDLCFVYGSALEFKRETLEKIRKMGIPVALWWLDEKHAFKTQKSLIGSYDLHLTNSFEVMKWYIIRGQASYYFPQAADPEIYKPRDLKRDIPVSFVGGAYGWRRDFIKFLRRAGIPVECFGSGWPNGVVNDIVEIFCRSKINLGIGFTGKSKHLTCIKERDFQVPATRSLYLTTFDPELTKHFIIGHEILCYRNEYDCVELIRYYLHNYKEAEEIAFNGYKRFLNDHTWTKRMKDLLIWMGILRKQNKVSK